jgi:hypothetical protein
MSCPVAPEFSEVTFEGFAKLTRVITTRDIGIKIAYDPPLSLGAYFAEILQSLVGETIVPAHF